MATYSADITVGFGGATYEEVTAISWSYGGDLPIGKFNEYTDSLGTLTLTCLNATGISTSDYGTRADLTVSGGGANLTHKAVLTEIGVTPELNDVTKYTVSFTLVDD